MLEFIIGAGAILLGIKGFTAEGLPFTNTKRLNGGTGKVVGSICILIGLLFLLDATYALISVSRQR